MLIRTNAGALGILGHHAQHAETSEAWALAMPAIMTH
jgi:hypothetical protein